MKLLVKNGMIATESQVFRGDILIEDEKIKSIGTVLEEEDAEVIDPRGCGRTYAYGSAGRKVSCSG